MPNCIEPAPTSRARCVVCDKAISKATPRLAEETTERGIPRVIHRYYHLDCAAAVRPDTLQRALGFVKPGCVFDQVALEAKLAKRLAPAEARQRERHAVEHPVEPDYAGADDEQTRALIAQLGVAPDDPAMLAVLGDHLQAVGDPRGELISTQLALAAEKRTLEPSRPTDDDDDDDDDDDGDDDAAIAARRARIAELGARLEVLFDRLAVPLGPRATCTWGIGFIRRLELTADIKVPWDHASLRCLAELRLAHANPAIVVGVPSSVRILEVALDYDRPVEGLQPIVAAMPHLERLVVHGELRAPLAHGALVQLVFRDRWLYGGAAAMGPHLAADALPALRELVIPCLGEEHYANANQIHGDIRHIDEIDPLLISLRDQGLLAQLTHLALPRGILSERGVDALVGGLAGRQLARLDLEGSPLSAASIGRLAACSQDLVFTEPAAAAAGELWVEHLKQPAWGRGTIVRRFDGKLEIEFEHAGTKIFKAGAPFLRLGSG